MKRGLKFAFGAVAAAAAAAAYTWLVRPWHLHWGSTREELDRTMPLDDVIVKPNYVTTRAVTINAPAARIWPWLVQMGELPRAGFYTYAWIERLLGMDVENASEILADFQQLKPGDHLDRSRNIVVKAIEPPRYLVLGPPTGLPAANATWAIELVPKDDETTRLISRIRARISPNVRGAFWMALLDPGQFVMERKWLLGVKARAEQFDVEERRRNGAWDLLDELVTPVVEKIEPPAEHREEEKVESLDVQPIGV
jgi:hypothetical protein